MMTVLRRLMAMTVLLIASATANAQTSGTLPASCWAATVKGSVVVTMTDGSVQRATLACLGSTEAVLAESGSIPIDSILRIDKPRDGILDGVLKGAIVGFVSAAGFAMMTLCETCTNEQIFGVTAASAVFGGILDAERGNNVTIFRRGVPSPSLAWRIRF
jgi:hypothetical protein